MPVKEGKKRLIPKERTKVSMRDKETRDRALGVAVHLREEGGMTQERSRSLRVPLTAQGTVLAAGASRPTPRSASFLDTRPGSLHLRGPLSLCVPSKHPLHSVRSHTKPVSSPPPSPAVGTHACFSGPSRPQPLSSQSTKHRAGHSRAPARCVDFGIFSVEGEKVQMTSPEGNPPPIMEVWIRT